MVCLERELGNCRYEHPKYYKIVSEFPMTGSGKVQKFKMAEIAAKEYSEVGSGNAEGGKK